MPEHAARGTCSLPVAGGDLGGRPLRRPLRPHWPMLTTRHQRFALRECITGVISAAGRARQSQQEIEPMATVAHLFRAAKHKLPMVEIQEAVAITAFGLDGYAHSTGYDQA